jgi:hypothetical protein
MRCVLVLSVLLLCCVGAWAQAEGPVTIGGVTYQRIDPGEPFVEQARPAQDWQPPAPTKVEQAAGMMAFIAPDPGEYRPYRIPKPTERTDRLQAFLTPGEDEAVTFGVFTLAEIRGLTVTVDLKGAPLTVDIRHEHCWPQRTGWRSRQWYMTPELLLPCAGGKKTVPTQRGLLTEVAFDLAPAQTQGIWLTLSAPADAKAGRYEGTVTLSSAGAEPLALPVEIEILPFRLQRPADRAWLLYGDSGRWTRMTDEQVLAEMRDFRRHGMDGLIEGPLGTPDVSRLREGIVTYDASRYRKYSALGHQVGMDGPNVIGSAGADLVKRTLGIDADLNKGPWPPEVTAGVQAIARAAVEATKDLPSKWYYYGVDEPTGENTFAIQDYQAWHAGGARTYATFYVPSFLEKASAFLTAPCFVVGLVSNEQRAKEAREACEKTGAEFWWYGTGSYVNPFPQEGYMWHNRYGAGLLFWKTGARASATWTFCRPHEDAFNDFDGSNVNRAEPKEQCTVYPHFLKADDWSTYQGAIPTIAWESLREGVDDYLYLSTLTSLIRQAQESPLAAARAAAQEAQDTLDALVESVPWANPMGPVGFEARRLQQVRKVVAGRIVALQDALAGRPYQPVAATEPEFSLRVKTVEASRALALPVLSVVTDAGAPAVDGRLDDACWKSAAVAGDFVDIRNGEASKLPTGARVLADAQALYVGFDCPEPNMAAVQAKETQHDGTVWTEDEVELFVGGASRKPYVHVIVTTANVVLDERNQDSAAWNPKLQIAVAKGKDRWSVEIAIPWSELAAAGVAREPVMSFNFGRARHVGGDAQTHTAWSCTYNGFHVPERFGIGLLQQGSVALESLRLPAAWGAASVDLALRNASDAPMAAQAAVRGTTLQTRVLRPGETASLRFSLALRHPGERSLALSWGAAGQAPCTLQVPITVPEPVAVSLKGGLVSPGSVVDVPVSLGLVAAERDRYRLEVKVAAGGRTVVHKLAAQPGETVSIPVRTTGAAQVQVLLVDARGRAVRESEPRRLMMLPD